MARLIQLVGSRFLVSTCVKVEGRGMGGARRDVRGGRREMGNGRWEAGEDGGGVEKKTVMLLGMNWLSSQMFACNCYLRIRYSCCATRAGFDRQRARALIKKPTSKGRRNTYNGATVIRDSQVHKNCLSR